MSLFQLYKNEDLSVVVSELLVATADSTDPLVDGSVNEVLSALRERLNMDVVFVGEMVNGQRVFRFVDRTAGAPELRPGEGNPVEETYCQRIIDGRLPPLILDAATLPAGSDVPPSPIRVGAHLSTPIVLKGGRIFGTLCCFSQAPNPRLQQKDLMLLQQCAQLVARKLDLAEAQGVRDPAPLVPNWSLEPVEPYESKVWRLP